jgi:hypothetical protein
MNSQILRPSFFVLILLKCTVLFGQQTDEHNLSLSSSPDSAINTITRQMPSFGGGNDLQTFITKESKIKTSTRRTDKTKNVFTSTIIEKDGHVTFDKIVRGYSANYDNEAIRVISKMPKWNPGKLNDSTFVRVVMLIPFWFDE